MLYLVDLAPQSEVRSNDGGVLFGRAGKVYAFHGFE
jgi:hypothetical protein